MSLARELTERGYVYQCSAESVAEVFDGPPRTVYLGIDPTADSMHVGHLVPYMMLNHIARAGHQVIILMGGGTALIGDPSFKDQERDIADVSTITAQCAGLERNVRDITVGDDIRFVNNYDWLTELNAIEFLRDVGKHFSVNNMIKKESVARRFQDEAGISYTEFSYSLLQAYDFYHLHTTYGCNVQIGGSDQWGNIIAGVDYVRRRTGAAVYGLTMQLITDRATGKKFGKSEGNAVWLDPAKTSPFTFYQFWFNTSDESVIDYLKLFTFLSLEEIATIATEHQADPAARSAQKTLAHAVTSFVHNEAIANRVARASAALFGQVALRDLSADELAIVEHDAPLTECSADQPLPAVLVASGLAASMREARDFITRGAVAVDGVVINDVKTPLPQPERGDLVRIKRGKRNLAVVRLVAASS